MTQRLPYRRSSPASQFWDVTIFHDWGWAEPKLLSLPSPRRSNILLHYPQIPTYLHWNKDLAEHELPSKNLDLLKSSSCTHTVHATSQHRWLYNINTINVAIPPWSSLPPHSPGFPLKVSLSLAKSSVANCFPSRDLLSKSCKVLAHPWCLPVPPQQKASHAWASFTLTLCNSTRTAIFPGSCLFPSTQSLHQPRFPEKYSLHNRDASFGSNVGWGQSRSLPLHQHKQRQTR